MRWAILDRLLFCPWPGYELTTFVIFLRFIKSLLDLYFVQREEMILCDVDEDKGFFGGASVLVPILMQYYVIPHEIRRGTDNVTSIFDDFNVNVIIIFVFLK